MYAVYAIRYAHHPRRAADNFLGQQPGDDPHDAPMPLDYFVWALVGENETIVVDTGFGPEQARARGRNLIRAPSEGLKAIGIDPASVKDVIITHMHYDHAGGSDAFPNARFHIQDREMAFCTGRAMCNHAHGHAFAADDVAKMVHRLFEGRVQFHDGESEMKPGISLHRIGGHTAGLQAVRVMTKNGPLVLASDAMHLYAHLERGRAYPVVFNLDEMLSGHETLKRLAGPGANSAARIIPGHDPLVCQRYPAAKPGLENIVLRLD
jgi:glyoxylase-like metal-dependent hydrolase (beta-lactamase superfamily II)